MKKQVFFLLIGMMFSFSSAFADVAVQYKVSRTHGLIKFVMAVSGEPNISDNIKLSLERSKFKDSPKVLEALKKIESIQNDLHAGIEYESEKSLQRRGSMDVVTFINIQSIFASSIDDLSTRVMGMMPMATHAVYFSALKEIDPIYEELYWRKSSQTLYGMQSHLESIARRVKLSDMFKKTEKFYEASWPAETPFIIGLYPILRVDNYDRNATTSQSLGNIEEHGVMVGGKRKDSGDFGVVFHELCHSVYGAQSPETMAKWENYFSASKSPYRLYTSIWLNETLATVLGNGWAYFLENKVLEKDNWYNHPIIDKFAQALYPKTLEYLDAGKSLDQEFAEHMITKFAELFPDSIYDYSNILNRIVIASDGEVANQRDFIRLLRKNFSIAGIGVSSPLTNKATIASIKTKPNFSVMFIFSGNSRENLKKALAQLPELGTQSKMFLNMKPRQIFSYQDTTARSITLIRVEKPQDLRDVVDHMKKNKINPVHPLTSF
ncbi:hypothetical protein AZI86_02170 [Bdellovibrio bacteriovorus]|uniref:Uncharacterized protein n=1 Tax=Bdellovibrio bacteriovorus TaxID=959 RepID=A0A150WN63_BDEBC|nr:hypothetical protein [Bdellovibrio bacteriovorus]KYG65902.1 hypothetical protein AZI86_02170 [Bdellovibrio bacteriovorus]